MALKIAEAFLMAGKVVIVTGAAGNIGSDIAEVFAANGAHVVISDRAGDGLTKVGDYLRLAGGPTKGADERSVFVVRANGTVASSRQESGWFRGANALESAGIQPGDTIFVPEEMDKTTWIQNAKDWTTLLYQFGIGLAGIKSALGN